MTARRWQDLTTAELAALPRGSAVAVLPVAATEQHGPHLPLSTDSVIAGGIAERAAALLPPAVTALTLPPVDIGFSPEHGDFPGTLSLSATTLLAVLGEIGASVARAGLRRLVLLNSHGGQPGAVALAAQELRARHGMAVAVANTWALMRPAEHFGAQEIAQGIHGGAVETSLMLHLAPGLVRRDALAEFPSAAADLAAAFPLLAAGGRLRLAWQAQDLNAAGAIGDARRASEAVGKALVEQAAQGLAATIEELSRFPVDRLVERR